MSKVTFILGGVRSGKSSYAVKLAKKIGGRVAFVATGLPFDGEMKRRIKLHQKKRPKAWQTFEETKNLPSLLNKISSKFDVIIIDCLTLFISNCLMESMGPRKIEVEARAILKALKRSRAQTIIVSNEVGLGIVPDNPLARDFRDIAGRVNQIVAQEASEVFFMIAGLATSVKAGKR